MPRGPRGTEATDVERWSTTAVLYHDDGPEVQVRVAITRERKIGRLIWRGVAVDREPAAGLHPGAAWLLLRGREYAVRLERVPENPAMPAPFKGRGLAPPFPRAFNPSAQGDPSVQGDPSMPGGA